MNWIRWNSGLLVLAFSAMLLSSTGCGKTDKNLPKDAKDPAAKAKPEASKEEKKVAHAGWWCEEHGIPEHICSLCSEEVATQLKKDGDWCKIHDRAQSQCFKCDAGKYAKFEAMYEAKYGKKPPRPPEEEFKK